MHVTPMDGIVDGGEVYTEEELAIINKEGHIMSSPFPHSARWYVALKNDGTYIIVQHDPITRKDRYLFGFGPYTKAEAIAWRNTLHTA